MRRTAMHTSNALRPPLSRWSLAIVLALVGALGCGSSGSGESASLTLPPSGALRGLVTASSDLSTWDAARGSAPAAASAALAESGLAPSSRFTTAVPEATVGIDGTSGRVATARDGTFFLSGLAAGDYALLLQKTVDGNLLDASVPVHLAAESGTALLVEMSSAGYRVTQRYRQNGRVIEKVLTPNGSMRQSSDDVLTAYALPGGATYSDGNGDGNVDGCTATGSEAAPPPPTAVPDEPSPRPEPPPTEPPGPPCTIGPIERIEIQSYFAGTPLVVGQIGYLAAIGFDRDGNAQDVTQIVAWESTSAGVASVDGWGAITGRSPGKTRIRATLGDVRSESLDVEVIARPALTALSVQNVDCFIYPLDKPVAGGGVDAPPPGSGEGSGGSGGSDGGGSGAVPLPPAGDLFLPYSCGDVVEIGAVRHYRATGQFGASYYEDVTDEVAWAIQPAAVGTLDADGTFHAVAAGDADIVARLAGVTSEPSPIRVVTEPTLVAVDVYTDYGVPVPLATPAPDDTKPEFGGGSVPGGSTTPTPPLPGSAEPSPVPSSDVACIGEECLPVAQTILIGDTIQFHALARYDTGATRDVTTEVRWSSSAPLVGLVGPAGKLTALVPGTTEIRASLAGVTSTAYAVEVVKEATAQALYVYGENPSAIAKKGERTYFHATAYYDVASLSREVTGTVTWISSDPSIARFDSAGVLVGRAPGFVEVWARLGSLESTKTKIEVWETSNLEYCDPDHVNRAEWSDDLNRVTLETDCASYDRGNTVTMRYTIDEVRPNPAPLIDPCLDLFVYSGDRLVRTVREEGCGVALAPEPGAAAADAALYQTLAFWDQRDASGALVEPGEYRIVGVFYIYYDPVIELSVEVR